MIPLAFQQIRRRFEEFLVPLLAEMGCAEHREYGQFYIHGLLLDGGRIEGWSWRGWHHHVTLTMLAAGFWSQKALEENKPVT